MIKIVSNDQQHIAEYQTLEEYVADNTDDKIKEGVIDIKGIIELKDFEKTLKYLHNDNSLDDITGLSEIVWSNNLQNGTEESAKTLSNFHKAVINVTEITPDQIDVKVSDGTGILSENFSDNIKALQEVRGQVTAAKVAADKVKEEVAAKMLTESLYIELTEKVLDVQTRKPNFLATKSIFSTAAKNFTGQKGKLPFVTEKPRENNDLAEKLSTANDDLIAAIINYLVEKELEPSISHAGTIVGMKQINGKSFSSVVIEARNAKEAKEASKKADKADKDLLKAIEVRNNADKDLSKAREEQKFTNDKNREEIECVTKLVNEATILKINSDKEAKEAEENSDNAYKEFLITGKKLEEEKTNNANAENKYRLEQEARDVEIIKARDNVRDALIERANEEEKLKIANEDIKVNQEILESEDQYAAYREVQENIINKVQEEIKVASEENIENEAKEAQEKENREKTVSDEAGLDKRVRDNIVADLEQVQKDLESSNNRAAEITDQLNKVVEKYNKDQNTAIEVGNTLPSQEVEDTEKEIAELTRVSEEANEEVKKNNDLVEGLNKQVTEEDEKLVRKAEEQQTIEDQYKKDKEDRNKKAAETLQANEAKIAEAQQVITKSLEEFAEAESKIAKAKLDVESIEKNISKVLEKIKIVENVYYAAQEGKDKATEARDKDVKNREDTIEDCLVNSSNTTKILVEARGILDKATEKKKANDAEVKKHQDALDLINKKTKEVSDKTAKEISALVEKFTQASQVLESCENAAKAAKEKVEEIKITKKINSFVENGEYSFLKKWATKESAENTVFTEAFTRSLKGEVFRKRFEDIFERGLGEKTSPDQVDRKKGITNFINVILEFGTNKDIEKLVENLGKSLVGRDDVLSMLKSIKEESLTDRDDLASFVDKVVERTQAEEKYNEVVRSIKKSNIFEKKTNQSTNMEDYINRLVSKSDKYNVRYFCKEFKEDYSKHTYGEVCEWFEKEYKEIEAKDKLEADSPRYNSNKPNNSRKRARDSSSLNPNVAAKKSVTEEELPLFKYTQETFETNQKEGKYSSTYDYIYSITGKNNVAVKDISVPRVDKEFFNKDGKAIISVQKISFASPNDLSKTIEYLVNKGVYPSISYIVDKHVSEPVLKKAFETNNVVEALQSKFTDLVKDFKNSDDLKVEAKEEAKKEAELAAGAKKTWKRVALKLIAAKTPAEKLVEARESESDAAEKDVVKFIDFILSNSKAIDEKEAKEFLGSALVGQGNVISKLASIGTKSKNKNISSFVAAVSANSEKVNYSTRDSEEYKSDSFSEEESSNAEEAAKTAAEEAAKVAAEEAAKVAAEEAAKVAAEEAAKVAAEEAVKIAAEEAAKVAAEEAAKTAAEEAAKTAAEEAAKIAAEEEAKIAAEEAAKVAAAEEADILAKEKVKNDLAQLDKEADIRFAELANKAEGYFASLDEKEESMLKKLSKEGQDNLKEFNNKRESLIKEFDNSAKSQIDYLTIKKINNTTFGTEFVKSEETLKSYFEKTTTSEEEVELLSSYFSKKFTDFFENLTLSAKGEDKKCELFGSFMEAEYGKLEAKYGDDVQSIGSEQGEETSEETLEECKNKLSKEKENLEVDLDKEKKILTDNITRTRVILQENIFKMRESIEFSVIEEREAIESYIDQKRQEILSNLDSAHEFKAQLVKETSLKDLDVSDVRSIDLEKEKTEDSNNAKPVSKLKSSGSLELKKFTKGKEIKKNHEDQEIKGDIYNPSFAENEESEIQERHSFSRFSKKGDKNKAPSEITIDAFEEIFSDSLDKAQGKAQELLKVDIEDQDKAIMLAIAIGKGGVGRLGNDGLDEVIQEMMDISGEDLTSQRNKLICLSGFFQDAMLQKGICYTEEDNDNVVGFRSNQTPPSFVKAILIKAVGEEQAENVWYNSGITDRYNSDYETTATFSKKSPKTTVAEAYATNLVFESRFKDASNTR